MAAFAFAAIALVVWSCNKEEGSETSYELTEADKVVASAEFQVYRQALEDHTKAILASFRKLSNEDRQKMQQLIDARRSDDKIDLSAEISQIVGWDLKEGFAVVNACRAEIDLNGVSSLEIRMAIRNYNKNMVKTRNSGPQEIPGWQYDMIEMEIHETYWECLFGCDSDLSDCYYACGKISDQFARSVCELNCYEDARICSDGCEGAYYEALWDLWANYYPIY